MKQVCVLGNGQLGRMLRQAGEPLGIAVWPVGLEADPEAVPFQQSVITAEIERWPETALTRDVYKRQQYEADARTLFEFTTDVKVIESPILFRDEGMRTACSPDGLCSDGRGLELKCPFTSRDFMKFRLGGFEAIKSAYMAQVQFLSLIHIYRTCHKQLPSKRKTTR